MLKMLTLSSILLTGNLNADVSLDFTNPKTNSTTKKSFSTLMVEGDLDEYKHYVVEFKSYYCAPCKKLKTDVLDEVHEHFNGTGKVLFIQKWVKIGADETPLLRTYCAAKAGSPLSLITKHLFKSPNMPLDQFWQMVMPDDTFSGCLSSQEANSWVLGELGSRTSFGVDYVPQLFVDGKSVSTNVSKEDLIRMLER